jgi:hypothetical protein
VIFSVSFFLETTASGTLSDFWIISTMSRLGQRVSPVTHFAGNIRFQAAQMVFRCWTLSRPLSK